MIKHLSNLRVSFVYFMSVSVATFSHSQSGSRWTTIHMFWMNFTSNSMFVYFAVFMRHIHRYIRVRVYSLFFSVFRVADRRSRDSIFSIL